MADTLVSIVVIRDHGFSIWYQLSGLKDPKRVIIFMLNIFGNCQSRAHLKMKRQQRLQINSTGECHWTRVNNCGTVMF